ncbi:MAG: thioredoxin family protein [Myxococcota bacterium]|nr:thioredoxin family protein [Myxococcota bacterium]
MRAVLGAALLVLALGCEPSGPAAGDLGALARCLSERGVVYYGSATCSACRAQKQEFGDAFAAVTEVECHPHSEDNDTQRCLARGIQVTPTWLIERSGEEVGRLEGARPPDELAAFSGCPYGPPG